MLNLVQEREVRERYSLKSEEGKKLSQEDEMVYLYTKLSREEMERNTYIEEAKEMGLQMGINQGIEKGIAQGIERVASEKQKEIVKELLKISMPIEQISQVTKLSTLEVEEIKKEIYE